MQNHRVLCTYELVWFVRSMVGWLARSVAGWLAFFTRAMASAQARWRNKPQLARAPRTVLLCEQAEQTHSHNLEHLINHHLLGLA